MSAPIAESVSVPGQRGGFAGWLLRNLQLLLGLLISGWSIMLLAREVDPAKVARALENPNWGLLVACMISIPVTMVFKAIRWRYLFGQTVAPPTRPLLSALYIGYLMNTILPARIGEFVRAYLIGRYDHIGVPAALATIVLEKLLDLATLALMLLTLILVTPLPDWVTPIARTSAAALAAGVVGLGILLGIRRRVVSLIGQAEARFAGLRRLKPAALAASFLDGLSALGRRETLPGLLFWSAAIWSGAAFTIWSGLVGAGLSVGLTAALLVLIVTNIGMAVPSAPGYVGVYHGLVVLSLQPFGVDPSEALGAAIVLHALIFGNFIVCGLWFLWRGGYSLGRLRDASGHQGSGLRRD